MKNLKSLIEEALYKASHCDNPIVKKKANVLAEDAYQMKKINEFYARTLAEDALYLIKRCGPAEELYNRILTGTFPLSLINSAARTLVEWNIIGKTVQTPAPTPSNPVEIKAVGDKVNGKYKVNWKAKSPNLYNNATATKVIVSATGVETANNYYNLSTFIEVKDGIYISATKLLNDSFRICRYDQNKNFLSRVDLADVNEYKIDNCAYVRINFNFQHWTAASVEAVYEIKNTPVMLNEPLMEGEKLKSTGEREVKWEEYVCTGEEQWEKHSTLANWYQFQSASLLNDPLTVTALCTHYNWGTEASTLPINSFTMRSSIADQHRVVIKGDYDTVEDLKAYLRSEYSNGTPVTIWYKLATPTSVKVSVPHISTFGGNSTLDVTSEVKPTSATITYKSTTEA